jgi:integrase
VAVEAWITERTSLERRSEATVRGDAALIRRFARFVGDIQVRSLVPEHVDRFFLYVRSPHAGDGRGQGQAGWFRGISDSTFNQYRSRLSVFFKWCVEENYPIRRDLLKKHRAARISVRDREQPRLDVLQRMLEETSCPRNRYLLALAMNTGMRASEIIRLRVGDFPLARDSRTGQYRLTAYKFEAVISKNHGQDRMPITGDLAVETLRWLHIYEADLGRTLQAHDYLLPGRISTRFAGFQTDPVSGDRVPVRSGLGWKPDSPVHRPWDVVKEAMRAVGYVDTKGEGVHTLRRAFALNMFEQLLQGGEAYIESLRIVGSVLHHKSTTITERYLGLTSARVQRDDLMAGKFFFGPPSPDGAAVDPTPSAPAARPAGPPRREVERVPEAAENVINLFARNRGA